MSLLNILGIDDTVIHAERYTRYNNEIVPFDVEEVSEKNGHWKLGHIIDRQDDGNYNWETYTICDGIHEFNFTATVTRDGKLLEGVANCFALGVMPLDQAYIDELLEEIQAKPIQWDVVLS